MESENVKYNIIPIYLPWKRVYFCHDLIFRCNFEKSYHFGLSLRCVLELRSTHWTHISSVIGQYQWNIHTFGLGEPTRHTMSIGQKCVNIECGFNKEKIGNLQNPKRPCRQLGTYTKFKHCAWLTKTSTCIHSSINEILDPI